MSNNTYKTESWWPKIFFEEINQSNEIHGNNWAWKKEEEGFLVVQWIRIHLYKCRGHRVHPRRCSEDCTASNAYAHTTTSEPACFQQARARAGWSSTTTWEKPPRKAGTPQLEWGPSSPRLESRTLAARLRALKKEINNFKKGRREN